MQEAFGSDFEIGTKDDYKTAGNAWTSAGIVLDVTPPEQTTATISPPVALNAASRTKQTLPGATDPGTAEFTLGYEPGKYQAMKDKQGQKLCFRVKLAGSGSPGKAIAFNGFINKVGMPVLNEDGFEQVSVGIQVSGDAAEVAYTAAAAGGGA